MAAPGGSAVRAPYSGGGNQSVDSGLSGHVGSVAPAGPSAALLEDHSSEGNSHRVSQVSVALSGEVRNAASAAFSSRSIEGESALSHNVEACSQSQVDGGLLQRRWGSLEENMSVRSNDVRTEPMAGPSRPAMASQHGQSLLREAIHGIVRGLENGGSGNYQAARRAQLSAPSNMGVEHSSRGGGVSISQAVQGQNFQPGIDWEVEMPQNNFGDYLSPGPAGSSGNHEQASGSLQVPCLALASGTQRRPCGSEEPGGRLDNQASVSVSQRVLAESMSAPVPRLMLGDPAASAANTHDQRTLRQSLQAVMRRAFSHVRGSEAVQASVSRNTAEAPSNFALPYPPLPAQGAEHFVGENNAPSGAANQGWHAALRREGASLTANSGGGMVGSAHGAPVADDVVSDADTNLSFLHRREQEQEHYHQGAVVSVPISGRLESDRSVAQNHHPAATVHTVVGSVEASQGAEQENPPGNNSTVDRQGSYLSGNTSTVNMSSQEDNKSVKTMEEDIDDTAHSEKTSGRSSSESPKSVTGLRQGGLQGSSAWTAQKRSGNANQAFSTTPGEGGAPKVLNHSGKVALSTHSQSIENPALPKAQQAKKTGNEVNGCSARSKSRACQSKKRKHSSDNGGSVQKSKW